MTPSESCLAPYQATENNDFTLHELYGYWHWYSCGPQFGDDYCSEDGFDTKAEASADAIDYLSSLYNSGTEEEGSIELPPAAALSAFELDESSPYQSGVHFALYQYENQPGVYWQGLCQEPNESAQWWHRDDDFAHLTSDRGYFDARTAAADCLFCLHMERGYSPEAAITLVYELGLPIHTVIAENETAVTETIAQLKAAEYEEQWSRLWLSDQQSIESSVAVLPEGRREQARYEMAFRTQPMPEQYWPSNA
ncbi:hypothetical protein S7335_918 [Synechococcus sp. PCC 7335]|uniref:hypothetical protein n=1 Tax=Synechococcus sp. (strain ATCC 29403 / PCC 7335) TaxID=91464 RepID=UPI00017EC82E|nr:hypothetical protein [Synechococcus sp. PCC 7335]EDX82361.1 hypothetical protein S7335_918 [Synechococcus sp. PCC 7335]